MIKRRKLFIIITIILIIIFSVVTVSYVFNVNKAVEINVENICTDEEYLDYLNYLNEEYSFEYSTDGKKVICFDINIKNNSVFKIWYGKIINKNYSVKDVSQIDDSEITELSAFEETSFQCRILVDEDIDESEVGSMITDCEAEVVKCIQNNSDDASYCCLEVDNVN